MLNVLNCIFVAVSTTVECFLCVDTLESDFLKYIFIPGDVVTNVTQILTLIYMGYFDYLLFMGGGAKKPPRSNSGI